MLRRPYSGEAEALGRWTCRLRLGCRSLVFALVVLRAVEAELKARSFAFESEAVEEAVGSALSLRVGLEVLRAEVEEVR
jgi:hypothetical protein